MFVSLLLFVFAAVDTADQKSNYQSVCLLPTAIDAQAPIAGGRVQPIDDPKCGMSFRFLNDLLNVC